MTIRLAAFVRCLEWLAAGLLVVMLAAWIPAMCEVPLAWDIFRLAACGLLAVAVLTVATLVRW